MATIIKFKKERETKNKIRYEETTDPPLIGTLYVSKLGLKAMYEDYPEKLTITLEAG